MLQLDEQISTEHLLLQERVCRSCGKEKSLLADFHRCGKNATLPSSYSYECKECSKDRAATNYWKKKKYDLIREKNRVCAVCNTTEPGGRFNKFVMDGNNLLCFNCNKIFEMVGDNIHTLESMVQYLNQRLDP
tara:strand:- start:817 stop:1215 length:399 start_codon:yes stop_codon:yes gene_type:complete